MIGLHWATYDDFAFFIEEDTDCIEYSVGFRMIHRPGYDHMYMHVDDRSEGGVPKYWEGVW